ncbi:MAG: hypothetical protein K2X08_04890 [Chlamydiales bacterium]|nr:hypothetical protein [Chlamydiales bacterium]
MARNQLSSSSVDEEIRVQGGLLNTDDHRFQMKVYETVELLQDACPFLQTDSVIRRLLAQFGEAYLFFNQTGELCFLTDFVKPTKGATF